MIYFDLFRTFFLLGMFSFGGGYASMELIRSRVVSQQHWLTNTEYTDIISIAEMTPGPLGINIASFVGTRTAGIPGTVIATLSYVLPALVIVSIMATIYYRCRSLNGVQGVLKGLRPAVAAMVFAAAVKLAANAYWGGLDQVSLENTNLIALPLSLVFLWLLRTKKLGPVQTILGSGVVGAVIYAILGMTAV
ncbi:MAG: chromate transporter [Clostridiales bacterium]|nr:chromate transporter [Clostridiales bacterium]